MPIATDINSLAHKRYVTLIVRLLLDRRGRLVSGELVDVESMLEKRFIGLRGLIRVLRAWLTRDHYRRVKTGHRRQTMTSNVEAITIGIPIYPGFDMLDVAGPYEVFSWIQSMWPNHKVEVLVIGKTCSPVPSSHGLAITPTAEFGDPDLRLDVLFVPGAPSKPLEAVKKDEEYISFLRKQAGEAHYVCSVCVGAILLAQAGLLDGYKATTHWAALGDLAGSYPKVTVVNGYPRYVIDGNRVTGAGISSGLDEALEIVRLITGSTDIPAQIQLAIQYSPDPPFNSGNPYTASYEIFAGTNAGFENL